MKNAFSFCLFGTCSAVNHRVENDAGSCYEELRCAPGGYYDGLMENLGLIEKHYPGWCAFVYMGNDVPQWFEEHLCRKHPWVIPRRTGVSGYKNTVYRFFAIDEPDVGVVFFRDVDSRIHWKDRWAINNFMSQNVCNVHIIRDHSQHTSTVAAGMWGMKRGAIEKPIRALYNEWTPVHAGSGSADNPAGFGIDQNFLENVVYPLFKPNTILVTHSNGCVKAGELGVGFPFEWTNDMYVGRVEAKPVTENFWLRELDVPPPQLHPVVMPRIEPPPAPVAVSRFAPLSFLNRSISGSGK